MNEATIQCKGIKKTYGDREYRVEALKGIDLEILSSQLTLLFGPSGSGKTTLLSIITTILTPDSGQLFLLGHEMNKMHDKEKALFCRDYLGIVFQSLFLVPSLTIVENVTLPLLVSGLSQKSATTKAMDVLNQLNIAHRSHSLPAFLSKGQQQRVAIARAIVNDAKIIVCDEPTSALDHIAGLEIMTLLHDLAIKSSKTVLVVTHDQRIFPFADRILKISDGELISFDDYE